MGSAVKKDSWKTILTLAYQSLGVVYGDLIISPLYVFKSTFAEDIQHSKTNEEILGALCFVFWTLTLIPLVKYVFVVLRSNDNGEGGTFALYSLLCRHARLSSLPNCQVVDEEIFEYYKNGDGVMRRTAIGLRLKSALENHKVLRGVLLGITLVGTCMVIGDGVLTPALSVFAAVSGLELSLSSEHHKYIEVPFVCIVLVCLFALQHYGTHRVGFMFAPVVVLWLICISLIGAYNIFHWNPQVFKAISPYYMYKFLKKTRKRGWMSLGGILLCITGSEAMFADLGHFSQLSIQIAFTCIVYPSLILAYMGQAAYLTKHHVMETDYHLGFYVSVPETIRWPVLAVAVLASIVGSQAIITGTFSIIKQCSSLGCFPKVKIVHTSSKIHGQIYIPEINWTLMVLCLAVTVGFRDVKRLGNACGLAVITVMLVTTCLMFLVMVLCWRRSTALAVCFLVFFGSIEALYFSASLMKFCEGAWVPVALSFIFLLIMYVWQYCTLKKYEFDFENRVSIDWLLAASDSLGIVRVRGIGLIQTELVSGIPAMFTHFVTNLPAFHQVLVFLCVKSVPVPHVKPEERFLVGRVGPSEFHIYRCIARYGYRDIHMNDVEFERDLVCSIAEFIHSEQPRSSTELDNFTGRCGTISSTDHTRQSQQNLESMKVVGTSSSSLGSIKLFEEDESQHDEELALTNSRRLRKRVRFILPTSPGINKGAKEELDELMEARESGMAFIMGKSYVKAKKGSNFLKRFMINFFYNFLMRNCRGPTYALSILHASTLEVGMVCYV